MKRKIASLLSLTMLLSSMSINVFADALPGSVTEAGGKATVNAIDIVKYRMVLPTTPKLDYIIDSQGLAQIESGESQIIGNLAGGNIYSNGNVAIANRSSKDVRVTATVKVMPLSADDLGDSTNGYKGAQIADTVPANVNGVPTFALAVVPSKETTFSVKTGGTGYNDVTPGNTTTSGAYEVTTDIADTAAKSGYWLKAAAAADTGAGIAVGDFVVAVPVDLKKANYVAEDKGTDGFDYAIDGNSIGGAISFSLAGKCSTGDEWSQAAQKAGTAGVKAPGVSVTYKFENSPDGVDWGDDTAVIVTDGLTNNSASGLKTAPIKVVTAGDDTKASYGKVDISLFDTDTANKAFGAAYGEDSTILTAANVTVKNGSTTISGQIEVDSASGVITFTATDADKSKIGADAVLDIFVEYDGKKYVKNNVEVEATEISDATATTKGITIPIPEGLTLGNINQISSSLVVKVDGTALDATAYTPALDDDEENIVITPTNALEEDNAVEVTFTAGGVPYKATAAVVAADSTNYASATNVTLTKGASAVYAAYADLPFSAGDVTKVIADVDGTKSDLTKVESETAFKLTIDSSWESATSVIIYAVTNTAVYKYTFK